MRYLPLLAFLLISSCKQPETLPIADQVVADAVESYGLKSLAGKKLEFDFRNRHYSLERAENMYTYTRSFEDSLGLVRDVLVNSSQFTRFVNEVEVSLDSVWEGKFSNSVNSVLYFVQLPLTLQDPAALKEYKGVSQIKDKDYHLLEVRFEEEGGGKDFEDVFLYWFSTEDFSMDYLAYSYITDGGGVRFREAINKRIIDGVTFQDYVNYKPENKETPLDQMASLFQDGNLIELSRIENENITVH